MTTPAPANLDAPPAAHSSRLLGVIAVGEVGVIAALILLVAFFTALEPAFVSERNVRAILRVVSFVGIIAIGQSMLLIAGESDLSVGSVAGLSAVVAAKLMTAAALPVPLTLDGGIVGVLLLQVVTSGLVVLGVSSNWQQIAVGGIMVLAVGLDIARRRYPIAGAGRRLRNPKT